MMKAGTYYVGDLCYVMHEVWNEFCDITIPENVCLDGEFTLKDGRKFATYGTEYGDGVYYDNSGREYGVDAGLIGCILLSDIDLGVIENDIKGGNVIEFKEDFETYEDCGSIVFGDVYVETNQDEEEDYDYSDEE